MTNSDQQKELQLIIDEGFVAQRFEMQSAPN